ncbi:MAG: hypothetical protein ACR2QQ_01665 [Gammaproteobacteria bacterium]
MQDLPFWKAILITLVIIALSVCYIAGTSLLGLNDPWIAFVAVTMWSATGMKMDQAPGIFLGAALGLLISLGMEALPDLYGEWAIIFPLAAIILAISCKIKEMFPLFVNFGLFIFLCLGSADIFLDQRLQLQYLQDLAFGALVFWILPWLVLRLKSWGEGKATGDGAT